MTHDHTWRLIVSPDTDDMVIMEFAVKSIMLTYISNYLERGDV
jgi:hypothetical protein